MTSPADTIDIIAGVDASALAWLLDGEEPAVRHRALLDLLGRPADDPEVVAAQAAAMATPPISAILDAQDPEGWWVAPGAGYLPKYRATVWQLNFLEQLGADPSDPRVRAACEYVLRHAQTASGGFGIRLHGDAAPPPSAALHCLNGNLLRALIGFGWLDDERVARAVNWQVAAITGEGDVRFYKSSLPGPGFRCGANAGLPCAWGATKAVHALARIPPSARAPHVQHALDIGIEFLLSRDPAVADYPMGYGQTRPNGSWFKLGFPSAYVTDVLEVMEACCEAGHAGDRRLGSAVSWLLAQQVAPGRWANRYPYAGKMLVDIDRPNAPSRWVTLRASRVLRAVASAGDAP